MPLLKEILNTAQSNKKKIIINTRQYANIVTKILNLLEIYNIEEYKKELKDINLEDYNNISIIDCYHDHGFRNNNDKKFTITKPTLLTSMASNKNTIYKIIHFDDKAYETNKDDLQSNKASLSVKFVLVEPKISFTREHFNKEIIEKLTNQLFLKNSFQSRL